MGCGFEGFGGELPGQRLVFRLEWRPEGTAQVSSMQQRLKPHAELYIWSVSTLARETHECLF